MTLQITFQDALKLLNQKEEVLLEQARQVRERKTQLLGALKFLGILELLDFPKHPREEGKKDPARTSPEELDYFGQTEFVRALQKAREDIAEEPFRSDPLFPGNPYAIRDIREKPYRAARGAVQGPKEPLSAQGNDPSEWLLDQANARYDEILASSTTLQELLDNLGGVRFNQDTIRKLLAGLINSDFVAKEPSKLNRIANDRSSLSPVADYWSSLSPVPDYWSDLSPIANYQSSHVRGPAVPDSLMKLRPDFRKTANLGENMERVGAAARGKTLNPNEVAKLLIHQGMYRAKVESLRYRVRQTMRNNPLQYEKIDEDTFLFISPVPDIGRTPGHPPA